MSTGPDKRKKAIDWASVRRRLARAAEASEGSVRLSPERARAVMDERARALARALARAPAEPAAAAPAPEVVVFDLCGECYAIATAHVREVVRLAGLAPLPGAPDFLAGVTNLRGQVLAVIDLGKLLGAARERQADASRVVILGGERAEFGLLAEAVHEVAALPQGRVRAPEVPPAGIGRDCLQGVTAEGLIVLDGPALLRDPRLFVDQGEETGT
jgi:purine-binding chemotaxis protein CheW